VASLWMVGESGLRGDGRNVVEDEAEDSVNLFEAMVCPEVSIARGLGLGLTVMVAVEVEDGDEEISILCSRGSVTADGCREGGVN